jgi:O-antigen/teichoic acid export membrane protein
MTQVKRNIIANYTGNIWTALMAIVFVPIYIRLMGIEAYGLVGFFTTMLSIFTLLEMGLSTTLNRELAKLSVQTGRAKELRNVVYTLGGIYWAVACLIVIIVIALSAYIAESWVKAENLSIVEVRQAVILMGIAIGLQWPISLYSGGLMGMQRQVLLNVISIVTATLRGFGAVIVLWFISPTIKAFFFWQIVISGSSVVWLWFALWRIMPSSKGKACFKISIIKDVFRFAAGMIGISILSTLLGQTDKIILSHILPLEMFGYYSLAGVVAMSLYRLIGPIYSGVYPRMTQLVALKQKAALEELYHRSCQMMSVMLFPAAMVLSFFSKEILFLWTQNTVTTEQSHLLVSLLVFGTALNGMVHIPYALQLAHGLTKLIFYLNLVSAITLVPLIYFVTKFYGAVGAASVWLFFNIGYVLIAIQLMHYRLIPDEKWGWYCNDVGIPLLCAVSIAGVGRMLIAESMAQTVIVISIGIVCLLTFFLTAIATPITREWLKKCI